MKRNIAAILTGVVLCTGTILSADEHGHDGHDHAPMTKPAIETGHNHDEKEHAHGKDEHGHDHGDAGHAEEAKLTAEAIKNHGIRIAEAQKVELAEAFGAPARFAYDGEAMTHVGCPVKGRVTAMKVKLGQEVKQGEELLVIESPELGEAQSDLIEKLALVSVAESAVGPAKEAYERGKKLLDESQGISLSEVQQRQAAWIAAQGAVKAATAGATRARSKLSLSGMEAKAIDAMVQTGKVDPTFVVRAPIAGRVIEREVTLGELVNPDRDALMVLADMKMVWAWVDVPEARLGSVKQGNEVTIRTTGAGSVTGKVGQISAEMNVATRTARVRVDLENTQGTLRPGMFGNAEFRQKADGKGMVAVPESAIQKVEGANAVFVPVEGEEGTFAPRRVELGVTAGGMVEVKAGLKEGEKYVTEGSFVLKAELGKAGAEHSH